MASPAVLSNSVSAKGFSKAHLRILWYEDAKTKSYMFLSKRSQKEAQTVWIFISYRIYWIPFKEDDCAAPNSLDDFRSSDFLELKRESCTSSWKLLKEKVSAIEKDERFGIKISGKLNSGKNVQLELITDDVDGEYMRDRWLHELRIRLAPWNLLHKLSLCFPTASSTTDYAKELERMLAVADIGVNNIAESSFSVGKEGLDDDEILCTDPSTGCTSKVSSASSEKRKYIYEHMQRFDCAEKLNTHLFSLCQVVRKAVKMGKNSNETSETGNEVLNVVEQGAKLVTEITKLIPGGVSAIFHLISLGARLMAMHAEAKRGRSVLPKILEKILIHFCKICEIAAELLHSRTSFDKDDNILFGNIFRVLVKTLDLIGKIEIHLMRGKVRQILNGATVKEIETEFEILEENQIQIVILSKKVLLKEQIAYPTVSILPPKPRVSPYFVGRKNELKTLKKIMESHGSAAITGHGGIGKTQLMSLFASQVEVEKSPHRVVYWITSDGDSQNVVESLAALVENIRESIVLDKDRKDRKIVVQLLKQELLKLNSHWLLCLDNVDTACDPVISGILSALTSFACADGSRGWVAITTRSGKPELWDRMKLEQKLTLEPLSTEDAALVLWRFKEGNETNFGNDEIAKKKIRELKYEFPREHKALFDLCGFELQFSLAGLPLALVQAGAYIRLFRCSFSEYLEEYLAVNEKDDLNEILERINEFETVREDQRGILTTWKINSDALSADALHVFRSMAMLGNANISEDMVKRIVNRERESKLRSKRRYQNVVLRELVFESSFLQECKDNFGRLSFNMHRLVRLFAIIEIDIGSVAWKNAFSTALISAHRHIKKVLDLDGNSFFKEPKNHLEVHQSLLSHSFSIILNFIRAGNSMELTERQWVDLNELHYFCRSRMQWSGRMHDGVTVFESALNLMYRKYKIQDQDHHDDIPVTLQGLGWMYAREGNLDKAIENVQKCVNMLISKHKDSTNLRVASSHNTLAWIYYLQGHLNKAVETALVGIDMMKKMLCKEGHPGGIDKTQNALTRIYTHERNTEERKQNVASVNCMILMATSYCNLSQMYKSQGELDKALTVSRKGLDIFIAAYGDNAFHIHIEHAYNDISLILQCKGELREAIVMARKSLYMRIALYKNDANNSEIAMSYSNLSEMYRETGNLEDAETSSQKSLKMRIAIYGEDAIHSDIALSYNIIGKIYFAQKRFEEARIMVEKGLSMRLIIYRRSSNHKAIACSYNTLAWIYKDQEKLDVALIMAQKSLDIASHGADANLPSRAASLNIISLIYQKQGNLEKAREMCEKCLNMLYSIHGTYSNHPSITFSRNNLLTMLPSGSPIVLIRPNRDGTVQISLRKIA